MDVEAVKARGAAMGLHAPRTSLGEVGRPPTKRQWRMIPASLLREGDTWVDHGVVYAINPHDDWATVYAGAVHRPTRVEDWEMVKAFTEVDMRYGKLDGKGKVHMAATSMNTDGFADTLCGKSGLMTMVADEDATEICAGCRRAADAM